MGLLDALFQNDSGGGGGLLDFLRNNALNQQMTPTGEAQYGQPQFAQQQPMQAPVMPQQNAQPSPLDNAQWPYGPNGAPTQANAQMPPQQPPQVIQAQPQRTAPQDSGMGIGDRLGAGFRGLMANAQTGPIGALMGGIAGVAGMGQGTGANQTAKALLAKGVDPVTVQAAIASPELMKALITHVYGPQNVTSLGEGYVTDKDGKVTRVYTPEQKDNFVTVQTGEDGLGRKTFQKMNKATGEMTPVSGTPDTGGGGLGDMNKTGAEYLATVPKAQQGIMQGMVDGTIQPPSSFALAKPYWQAMLAGAKNLDPTFDANNWATRHKMSVDMGASGNSSMGGILSNGKSSFKHLAEYTESAADLGNSSHDFPLGGAIAHAQNYVGNTLGGSDTNAKIKAINDNLGHYGQESTKFYAGTGGGVEERMNALKEMNPTTTSSEEMAAYAAKEKSLMLDRLREKEAQIRDTMGEAYLQRHPVFTPELQKDIARIDSNVAKLRGIAPTGNQTKTGVSWSVVK